MGYQQKEKKRKKIQCNVMREERKKVCGESMHGWLEEYKLAAIYMYKKCKMGMRDLGSQTFLCGLDLQQAGEDEDH